MPLLQGQRRPSGRLVDHLLQVSVEWAVSQGFRLLLVRVLTLAEDMGTPARHQLPRIQLCPAPTGRAVVPVFALHVPDHGQGLDLETLVVPEVVPLPLVTNAVGVEHVSG